MLLGQDSAEASKDRRMQMAEPYGYFISSCLFGASCHCRAGPLHLGKDVQFHMHRLLSRSRDWTVRDTLSYSLTEKQQDASSALILIGNSFCLPGHIYLTILGHQDSSKHAGTTLPLLQD